MINFQKDSFKNKVQSLFDTDYAIIFLVLKEFIMPYQKELNRKQVFFTCLEDLISEDSHARIIDCFIDSLDLKSMGFSKSVPAVEGRPSFSASNLLKLFLYGFRHSLNSSRKLEEACRINIEVKWLLKGLEPDFRTISNFRRDNIMHLKKVFFEFNRRLLVTLETGFYAIDGTKIQANNSKKRNFTANKLDDKIAKLNEATVFYIKQVEEYDSIDNELDPNHKFTKAELEEKVEKYREKTELFLKKRKEMEEKGLTQISLTDSDSKLMNTRNGFSMSYNVQTAVDSKTHIIKDFKVTDRPSDFGLLSETIDRTKKEKADEIVEVVADKGYECSEDMVECLEKGVIPNVISKSKKQGYELETKYEASEIDENTIKSRKADDIKKCLRAAVIPEVYKDYISDIKVTEKKNLLKEDESPESELPVYKMSEQEMRERALKGYFVRDAERNIVYCPGGFTLRAKSFRRNGSVVYANRVACKKCPLSNICNKTKSPFKEVEFSKDSLEKPCKGFIPKSETISGNKTKRKLVKTKVVKFIFKPDSEKMNKRKNIAEHPFGTIKRNLNGYYFLLRNKIKTTGEFALFSLSYNFKIALNMLGFNKMMAIMA